jgi:hypothetical protein
MIKILPNHRWLIEEPRLLCPPKLQQAWVETETGEIVWIDVPTVKEGEIASTK